MATGPEIIERSRMHWGKPYTFASEVKLGGADRSVAPIWYRDAKSFDCSEYTEATFGSFGIYLPDGSGAQGEYITRCDIEEAIATPGYLLGHDPSGGKPGHVVMSIGDGGRKSSEARSTAKGIGSWKLDGRGFTWAGYVPGVDMHGATTIPTPPPGTLAQLAQALAFVKQTKVGPGQQNSPDAVEFVRAGIDRLEPGKIPLHGAYDLQLEKEIDNIQRWCHINEGGVVGPLTWALLFP
jgi:hypothetical protein